MVKITFVEADGTEHIIDSATNTTLMQTAVNHLIPGIDGDCGGLCACGTCHVYIPEEWQAQSGEADELEVNILEFAYGVDDRSRLSCQINITDDLDGLVVRLPSRQY